MQKSEIQYDFFFHFILCYSLLFIYADLIMFGLLLKKGIIYSFLVLFHSLIYTKMGRGMNVD